MDTRSKLVRITGYPVEFTPGDYTLLQARDNPAFSQEVGRLLWEKLHDILLRHHRGADPGQLERVSSRVLSRTPRHWGILIEVLYRVNPKPDLYRHVFHLIMDKGDLSGHLFTQTRRHIAK